MSSHAVARPSPGRLGAVSSRLRSSAARLGRRGPPRGRPRGLPHFRGCPTAVGHVAGAAGVLVFVTNAAVEFIAAVAIGSQHRPMCDGGHGTSA